jgi:hypothetical protein
VRPSLSPLRGLITFHLLPRGLRPFGKLRASSGLRSGAASRLKSNTEDGMKSPCAVNLHHAVTVSQQRLGKRVAQLSSARMNEVCAALRFSLGCGAN